MEIRVPRYYPDLDNPYPSLWLIIRTYFLGVFLTKEYSLFKAVTFFIGSFAIDFETFLNYSIIPVLSLGKHKHVVSI